MIINFRLRRFATVFTTGIIIALTTAVVSKSAQTLAVPNALFVGYSLLPGQSTGPITPVSNQSVMVMGVQTTVGYRGVGSATLLHVPSSFIEWVGLESTSGSAITQGFSGSAGTHILYLDFSHQVDIQVASTDSVLIHNAASGTRTGNVTFIW